MATEHLAQVSFYIDWKFWAVAVSVLALILSQLPPLHILLRRAKLDVEAYSRMLLTHKLGNPNASLHIIISNTGGRHVKVKSIALRVRRGNDDHFILPAQNYLQTPSDKEAVLLTSFKLKPGDEWAHIINFFNLFSRNEEKAYRQLETNLRHDIGRKIEALENKEVGVAADDQNVAPLIAFFKNKFRWWPGEYELALEIDAEPKRASVLKKYRITLFESDSKELEDYQNGYKFGDGVYFETPRHAGIMVPLAEA